MRMTVGSARALAVSASFALAIFMASTAASHAAETSEAFIVPLFPQKEADLKKGLPPGMTAYSFWAGRGTAKLRRLDNGGAQITFDFEGLIPYGVYTLWNVLETNPFKDEPLGEFGVGKHSVVADGSSQPCSPICTTDGYRTPIATPHRFGSTGNLPHSAPG